MSHRANSRMDQNHPKSVFPNNAMRVLWMTRPAMYMRHFIRLSFKLWLTFFAVRILWLAQTRTWPNHTFQTLVSKGDKMEWMNWAMWFSVGRISGRKESESQSVAWNGWYQEVNAFYTTKGEREKKNDARGPKKVELAGEWASERTG